MFDNQVIVMNYPGQISNGYYHVLDTWNFYHVKEKIDSRNGKKRKKKKLMKEKENQYSLLATAERGGSVERHMRTQRWFCLI